MKCDYCGKEEALPFICNYCGGAFCADHRLPEAHQCKGDLTQKRTITAPPQTTFSWQTSQAEPQHQAAGQTHVVSGIEFRDITVAWLALGLAFAIANAMHYGLIVGDVTPDFFAYLFLLSILTVGPGFVFHELSHKFVAQRYGFWAEFRMWPQMLVLALITSLLGWIFAAPGATYISGTNISTDENGKISFAGPLMNILIALLFVPFLLFGQGFLGDLGYIGVPINIFLATFNMVPFGPLDGSKVFKWNKPIWVVVFVPLVVSLVFLYLYLGII